MGKRALTEDTVIRPGGGIPLSSYQAFLEKAAGVAMPGGEFQPWLGTQAGKTLGEAVACYRRAAERKPMEELLEEPRFAGVSPEDKAFLRGFTQAAEAMGYDFGGGIGDGYCWGKYMVVYAKRGTKSRQAVARIYIREEGIVLRLFLNRVDAHRAYIEQAPPHIKEAFAGSRGDCSCVPKKERCRMRKRYVIDGRAMEKCSGRVFEFLDPTLEKLPDYTALLKEFYPGRRGTRGEAAP